MQVHVNLVADTLESQFRSYIYPLLFHIHNTIIVLRYMMPREARSITESIQSGTNVAPMK